MEILLLDSKWPPKEEKFCDKIVLVYDDWDDYSYHTSFGVYYCDKQKKVQTIGGLKIYYYNNDKARTDTYYKHTRFFLMKKITQLGPEFCSLGQDLSYYRNLQKFCPDECKTILRQFNDLSFCEELKKKFVEEDGVKVSLLRFSGAEKALDEARAIFTEQIHSKKNISFKYRALVPYDDNPVLLDFDFSESDVLPYRINILIAKNGTGKTQILSNLANSLSGFTDKFETERFPDGRPSIDRVMSISYSAFDKFRKPPVKGNGSRAVFSYIYCGIQSEEGTLSLDELKENLKNAYMQVIKQSRETIWLDVLSTLMEKEHQHTVELIEKGRFDEVNLSSGQQILICTITELIANIENESIILFDEPEIHLHPNAISNVLRMFEKLLEEFNSYAIFSTHSPLILQEIPSRYIQILDRIDDSITVRRPDIECFGNSINTIIKDVFDVTNNESNYKNILRKLAQHRSCQEVLDIFGGKLGLNALMYLQSCYNAEDVL